MNLETLVFLILFGLLGFAVGQSTATTRERVGEVYCPMVESGEPTGECYKNFHVDGNCASLSNGRIHCGKGYLLEIK